MDQGSLLWICASCGKYVQTKRKSILEPCPPAAGPYGAAALARVSRNKHPDTHTRAERLPVAGTALRSVRSPARRLGLCKLSSRRHKEHGGPKAQPVAGRGEPISEACKSVVSCSLLFGCLLMFARCLSCSFHAMRFCSFSERICAGLLSKVSDTAGGSPVRLGTCTVGTRSLKLRNTAAGTKGHCVGLTCFCLFHMVHCMGSLRLSPLGMPVEAAFKSCRQTVASISRLLERLALTFHFLASSGVESATSRSPLDN